MSDLDFYPKVQWTQGFGAPATFRPDESHPSYRLLIQRSSPSFPIDFMRTDQMRNFIGLSKTGVDRSVYNRAIDEVSGYFNGTLRDIRLARSAPSLMSIQKMFGPSYNPLTTREAANWLWILYALKENPNHDDARVARAALVEVTRFFNDLKRVGQLA